MFTRHTAVVTRSMARQRALISGTVSNLNSYKFKDHPADNQFKLYIDSTYAHIDYDKDGTHYDLIHTNVPEELQGKGVGRILAKKAFDYIASQDGQMTLTCEYLQHVYEANKEKYQHLVE